MNLRLSFAVLSLAVASASSFASVAYSNLTSTDYAGGTYGGYYMGGYNPAFEFTSSITGTTDDILVDVGDYFTVSGSVPFQVNLYQDGGSNDSLGSLLGSWTGFTNSTPGNYADSLVDVTASGASLTAGGNYWVELQYGAYDDFSYYPGPTWGFNSAGASGNLLEDGGLYATGATSGAFQVNATSSSSSTPGPIAVAPFLLGLLGRRRKN